MYRRTTGTAARAISALVIGTLLHAAPVPAQPAIVARQVFSSDSLHAMSPTISPDERWLVFVRFISNQESRVMIRPLAGGETRELLAAPGTNFGGPRFTPQGDRIILASNLTRRGPTDDHTYLVSVPFETRTGTLSGRPRQISLDGIRGGPLVAAAVSPDGRSVAYVECCEAPALKVVPVTGGNARTLVALRSPPFNAAWSPDGRFLTYLAQEQDGFAWMRISRDGGTPVVVARGSEPLGRLSPDNRFSFRIVRGPSGGRSSLRLFAPDGKLVADEPLPARFSPAFATFAPNGKYIVGTTDNAVASMKIVPLAGGPIRQITRGEVYDWPGSWSEDGSAVQVYTEEEKQPTLVEITPAGEVRSRTRFPDNARSTNMMEVLDGYLVYRTGHDGIPTGWRIMARSLKDGSDRELAHDVVVSPGSLCRTAGGWYGSRAGELCFSQLSGNRLQVRSTRVTGESRLIGEVPARLLGKTGFAVYQDRLAYTEPVGDSVRLQLAIGAGRPVRTLGTVAKASPEVVWSHDGRQLAVSAGNPQTLTIYRFDAAGTAEGPPHTFPLPFEFWYETLWLPDGSGLTMIAQPRGSAVSEVALVRLADPEHPILLTRDDPVNKWGHSLSPDGKYVAYPSEQLRGTSVYLIEVAKLLESVQAKR